jgi:hypothetical protein
MDKLPSPLPTNNPPATPAVPIDKEIAADTPAAAFIQNIIAAKTSKPEVPSEKPVPEPPKPAGRKPKRATPPPAAAIDEEKLGESIGKSIAEHTAKIAPAPAPEKPLAEVDAKLARKLAVYQRMEALEPERYKGLADRYRENTERLRVYADQWNKNHPGETFDESADEHTGFIEALETEVDYDDDDYTEALADIRAERRLKSTESELNERLSQFDTAEKRRQAEPKIRAAGIAAGSEFWKDLGDDYKDVLDESGEVNVTALKALRETDPIKHDIAVTMAATAEGVAQTIYKLANGLEKYDPNNPAHSDLGKFAVQQESAMRSRPAEDQLDDEGRRFARKNDYDKMTPEKRAKHWTYSPDEIAFMAVHEIVKGTKRQLEAEQEKFTRQARARGFIVEDPKPAVGTQRGAPLRPPIDDDDGETIGRAPVSKPLSPSISTSPKLAANRNAKGNSEENGQTRFMSKFLGG